MQVTKSLAKIFGRYQRKEIKNWKAASVQDASSRMTHQRCVSRFCVIQLYWWNFLGKSFAGVAQWLVLTIWQCFALSLINNLSATLIMPWEEIVSSQWLLWALRCLASMKKKDVRHIKNVLELNETRRGREFDTHLRHFLI